MSYIAPIDHGRRERVARATLAYIDRAAQAFGCAFEPVPISFDLKGRAAGMYRVSAAARVIRYNPYLFAKYFEDNLAVTVPHEVAHYVTDMLHGLRGIRPHGPEWREVMGVFGVEPAATCDYDMDGIPVRTQRRFAYRCGCTGHRLTSRRHNKVRHGEARYFCRRCGGELVAAP